MSLSMREEGPGWTALLSIQGIWKKRENKLYNIKSKSETKTAFFAFTMCLFFLSWKWPFPQDLILTCWFLWTRWIYPIHIQATQECCRAGSWRGRRPTNPGHRCPAPPVLHQSRHDKGLDREPLQHRSLYQWSHSSGFQEVQCSLGKPVQRIRID